MHNYCVMTYSVVTYNLFWFLAICYSMWRVSNRTTAVHGKLWVINICSAFFLPFHLNWWWYDRSNWLIFRCKELVFNLMLWVMQYSLVLMGKLEEKKRHWLFLRKCLMLVSGVLTCTRILNWGSKTFYQCIRKEHYIYLFISVYRPTQKAYNILLDAFAISGMVEQARIIFKSMRRDR